MISNLFYQDKKEHEDRLRSLHKLEKHVKMIKMNNIDSLKQVVRQLFKITFDQHVYNSILFKQKTDDKVYISFIKIITQVLLKCTGHHLLQMKNFIDRDVNNQGILYCRKQCLNMINIVFDIVPENYKSMLINHFTKHMYRFERPIYHIVTDVDDTLFSGQFGGTDTIYNNHVYYPGVKAFHKVVNTSGFTTILTARFKEVGSQEKLIQKFKQQGFPYPTMPLLGEMWSTLKGTRDIVAKHIKMQYTRAPETIESIIDVKHMKDNQCKLDCREVNQECSIDNIVKNEIQWSKTYNSMGLTKYYSFCLLSKIYPEYRYIFIGDSGQGDLLTSLLMSQHPQVETCFVRDLVRTQNYLSNQDKKDWEIHLINDQMKRDLQTKFNVNVIYNYIDPLVYLVQHKVVTPNSAMLIANRCLQDFKTIIIENKIKNKDWLIKYKQDELFRSRENLMMYIKQHILNDILQLVTRLKERKQIITQNDLVKYKTFFEPLQITQDNFWDNIDFIIKEIHRGIQHYSQSK